MYPLSTIMLVLTMYQDKCSQLQDELDQSRITQERKSLLCSQLSVGACPVYVFT